MFAETKTLQLILASVVLRYFILALTLREAEADREVSVCVYIFLAKGTGELLL